MTEETAKRSESGITAEELLRQNMALQCQIWHWLYTSNVHIDVWITSMVAETKE